MTPESSKFLLSRRRFALVAAGLATAGFPVAAAARELASLAHALVRLTPREKPPHFSFATAEGKKQTLQDYRGRGVVLNVWATWCGPCVAEMPALDRLAAKVSKDAIVVLPISIDAKGLPVVKKFYAQHHIVHLPILLDPDGAVARVFKLPGIPGSFVIDREGRVAGRTLGPVAWDKPAAIATIESLVGPKNSKA